MGRPQDVGLNDVVRVVIGIRNRDQGPEVKDPLAPVDGPADGAGVFQVAALDLDGGLNIGGQVAQIAAVVAAVVADERPDLVAVPDQPLGQVAADEPPCPRHQDLLAHRQRHSFATSRICADSDRLFGRRSYGISAFSATWNEDWVCVRAYKFLLRLRIGSLVGDKESGTSRRRTRRNVRGPSDSAQGRTDGFLRMTAERDAVRLIDLLI